jgi:hypothetical protein
LAFAACGGGDDGCSNQLPVDIQIRGSIVNPSYMGFRPDLTGISIEIDYGGGNVVVLDDPLSFPISPNWVYGFYDHNTGTWTPNYIYNIQIAGVTVPLNLAPGSARNVGRLPFHGILRTDLEVLNPNHGAPGATVGPTNFMFLSANGLQVVNTGTRQEYYFHSEPEFGGLLAQALYEDGRELMIDLILHSDPDLWTPGTPVQGLIQPFYNAATRTDTGSGVLYVTVGRHPSYQPWRAPRDQVGNMDPGLTRMVPIERVHHVRRFEFAAGAPEIQPMFYWELDTSSAWKGRIPADTMFRVTFSNDTVQMFSLSELEEVQRVWWNENPDGSIMIMPDTEEPGDDDTDLPLHIAGVQMTTPQLHLFNNPNPRITFYFRGYTLEADVRVFSRLVELTVSPGTETVEFDRGVADTPPGQDNDNIWEYQPGTALGPTAQQFASRLTVTAVFETISQPPERGNVVLTYNHDLALDWFAGRGNAATGPVTAGWSIGFPAGVAVDEGRPPRDVLNPLTASLAQRNAQARRYTMNFGVNTDRFVTMVDTPNTRATSPDGHLNYPHPGYAGTRLLTGRTATGYRNFERTRTNWGLVSDPRNNGRTTRAQEVRIWYTAPGYVPGRGYNGPSPNTVAVIPQELTTITAIPVNWSGID